MSAILLVAFGLRVWGIGFGLPYEYHVDEVQYVRQAASMGAEGLEPVWWNNPPFYKYLLLAEYAALYGAGRLTGSYRSVADFGAQLAIDPTSLYLLGRGTSALFGALTVLVTYWIGKTAYNRRVGLLAAWFLATCFLHVRDSHYAVNDVPMTFFVTVATLASIRIMISHEKKWYVLAGAALGMGFATKYSAAFALVPILAAHFFSPGVGARGLSRLRLGRLAIAVVVAILAALIASPYFILTPGSVVQDVYEALYLAGQRGFDGWQIDPSGGYLFYLKSLVWGLGWGLLVLVLTGLVVGALRHSLNGLVLISLPITLYLMMGRQEMYFARFALPMVPALLLLGASLLENMVVSLTNSKQSAAIALVIGALLIAAQPLVQSVRADYLLTQTDTRTLAKEWIEANLPEGSRIAVDWPTHGPPLSTEEIPMPDSETAYDVTLLGGFGLAEHPIKWYSEQGFDYLIASSFIYEIPLVDEGHQAERSAFYNSLDEELDLVQAFRPGRDGREIPFIFDEIYGPAVSLWERERPGPTIKVYSVQR